MTSKHPKRCETCHHYEPGGQWCIQVKTRLSQLEIELIALVGCASHSSASGPVPEPGGAPNVSCDNDPCQFCFDGWCSFKCRKWDALVQTAATKARAEVLDLLIAYRKAQSNEFGIQTVWEGEGAYILELRQQGGKR